VVFAPRHGILSQLVRRLRLALRIAREDALATLFFARKKRRAGRCPGRPAQPRCKRVADFLLSQTGRIKSDRGGWRLTEAGRNEARELVRIHRLWEAYLTTRLALPPDHVHAPADRMEHFTDPDLRDRLTADLADPEFDPHGRPIPRTDETDRRRS